MQSANGHDDSAFRVNIDFNTLGPGWVVVEAGDPTPEFGDMPELLHRSLVPWLQEHPQITVRAVLPITNAGLTVAIHIWFDGEWPAPSANEKADAAASAESEETSRPSQRPNRPWGCRIRSCRGIAKSAVAAQIEFVAERVVSVTDAERS